MSDFIPALVAIFLTATGCFTVLAGMFFAFTDGKKKGFNEGLLANSLRDAEACLKMSALVREFVAEARSALDELDMSIDEADKQFVKDSSLDLK